MCGNCKELCHHTSRTCTNPPADLQNRVLEEEVVPEEEDAMTDEAIQQQFDIEQDITAQQDQNEKMKGIEVPEPGRGYYYVAGIDPGPGFRETAVVVPPPHSRRASERLGLSA